MRTAARTRDGMGRPPKVLGEVWPGRVPEFDLNCQPSRSARPPDSICRPRLECLL